MLRIRLSRVGRKKQPFFKIVVIPRSAGTKSRNFRDEVGTHDPVNKETTIDEEKARGWIAKGAQPTDTVHNLFVKHGVITGRKKEAHDKDPVEPEPKEEKTEKEEKEEKKETKEEVKKEEETEGKESEEEKPEEKEEGAEKEEEKKEESEDEEDEEEAEETEDEEEVKDEEDKEETEEEKEGKGDDLNSLDLTTRIINSLEDAGIDTVEKLKEKSEDELKEVKGVGPKSIEKIMEVSK